ncbi:MAG: hypothetical protein J6V90_10880 [Treponema sp.]|nr:hypothetical protein [Treponema sp.]
MPDIINITPYKELNQGEKCIYDFINKEQKIFENVINYLKTESAFLMSPGIYTHPFKSDIKLLGPYLYTDGKYCWDRDTWKYVVKYNLEIPDFFIKHVNSSEGKKWLKDYTENNNFTWKNIISEKKKNSKNELFLIPDDIGDLDLTDF